jgi:Spo0E like sporulation regulatory protein
MMSFDQLILEIEVEKKKLEELFNAKGCTDFAVLQQADQVDQLINQYDRMAKYAS